MLYNEYINQYTLRLSSTISSLIVSNYFIYSVVILISNVNQSHQAYPFHDCASSFTYVYVEFDTITRFTQCTPPSLERTFTIHDRFKFHSFIFILLCIPFSSWRSHQKCFILKLILLSRSPNHFHHNPVDIVMLGFKPHRRAHPCHLCLLTEEIEQQ